MSEEGWGGGTIFEVDRVGRKIRLGLHGELDLLTNAQLRQQLVSLPGAHTDAELIVDMTDVTCLSLLAAAHRRLGTTGGSLTVINAKPSLLRLARIAGLDRLFAHTVRLPEPRVTPELLAR